MIAAAMPAWPQNRLGAELIKLWGGTYSTNCGDPSAALAAELDRLWVAKWRQNR